MTDPDPEVESRLERFTRHTDLSEVAGILARSRDAILARWLEVTLRQPFHQHRSQGAVADHMPHLLDALVVLLHRAAPRWVDVEATMVDETLLSAAREHARQRFEQGLQPTDIVTEFRLLRQEIGRALRLQVDQDVAAGDIIGAELVIHDALDGAITLALSALTRRVEEVRDEFLAGTVHDVQQPITGIKGNLQLARRLLTRSEPDVRRADELLGRVEAQADRLARLVSQLANASQVALGRLVPHRTWTELMPLVQAVIGRLDPEAAQRVSVDVLDASEAVGWWDANLLERVIENLLANALKYAPAPTPVGVTIQGKADAVCLVVRDAGVGLSTEDLAMLFQRYRRTSSAAASSVPGQGLGLYLCRGIVEAHGGRIWAESPGPLHGSAFHVCLPRQAPNAAPEESLVSPA